MAKLIWYFVFVGNNSPDLFKRRWIYIHTYLIMSDSVFSNIVLIFAINKPRKSSLAKWEDIVLMSLSSSKPMFR